MLLRCALPLLLCLVACATHAQRHFVPPDPRRAVKDVDTSKEEDAVAVEASRSLVAITRIDREGAIAATPRRRYLGSGFVVGTGCHVITARHVVSGGVFGPWVATEEFSLTPLGTRVDMVAGLGPGQTRTALQGHVIFSGASLHGEHDVALIRLDQPAPVPGLALFAASDEALMGAAMVSVGIPASRQRGRTMDAYADTQCTGVTDRRPDQRQRLGGIQTNCYASAGDSGGVLMARVSIDGKPAWRAVGVAVQVDRFERLRAFPIQRYIESINAVLQSDLEREPCAADAAPLTGR